LGWEADGAAFAASASSSAAAFAAAIAAANTAAVAGVARANPTRKGPLFSLMTFVTELNDHPRASTPSMVTMASYFSTPNSFAWPMRPVFVCVERRVR